MPTSASTGLSFSADSTVHGIVWTPPQHPGPALLALNEMHERGVTAIRLRSLPAADTVLARADSLNLDLFVDLPVSFVPAGRLDDALRATQSTLADVQHLAAKHHSIQAVGLAHGADTTVPATCSALQSWTTRIHNASSLETYYVTPFTATSDRCHDAVDYPLIDTRGRPTPSIQWRVWNRTTPTVGIGALGTWTHPGTPPGLQVPHSPERQARYLETALQDLLSPDTSPPVFVYRWQDRSSSPLPNRRYGLHDPDGDSRPAADVLAGFYQDTQRVFAFPRGTAPSQTPLLAFALGWGILALLGGLYAQNPFVRQTVGRYFVAHGFYRDAVQKGREVSTPENLILLAATGVALGITGALSADIIAQQPVTTFIVEALPPTLDTLFATALSYSSVTGLFVGILCPILLLGWSLLLTWMSRTANTLSPDQGLMLVTWPCWPALLGMLAALVAATHSPFSPSALGLLLLLGGSATIIAVTVRILQDYHHVSGVSLPRSALLILPSPLSLVLLALLVLVTAYDLPISLLWHLLTRT